MFSVVLTTTGIAIKAKAIVPAHPEKCLTWATKTAYTNNPITIDGADNMMSFTKRVIEAILLLPPYSDR